MNRIHSIQSKWNRIRTLVCFLILICACQMFGLSLYASTRPVEIASNPFFTVYFNREKGVVSIFRGEGQPLVTGLVCAVNTGNPLQNSRISDYSFSAVQSFPLEDRLGTGTKTIISATDENSQLHVELQISLYDQWQAVVFEALCSNNSGQEIFVRSIEPLRAIGEESGSLFCPGASKCLLNGAMYYDAGSIHTLGEPFRKSEPYGEAKGGQMVGRTLSDHNQAVESWWNLELFSGYDHEAVTIGYLENRYSVGRIQLLKTDPDRISFVAESVYNQGHVLKPGQRIGSDKVMIGIASDPYQSLEKYAEMVGRWNQSLSGDIVNGWCHWFYTMDSFSEEEILRNARFAAEHLKSFGLEYIQLDEGYQTAHGNWEGNSRFPHGMKWLAGEIRDLGLKPGIWIAPFVISETTGLFRDHPDWLLKNEDGSLKRIGPWPGEETDWFRSEVPKRYGLDITHPEAEKWFAALIDTLVNSWGFEMLKIDFVAWTVFSADHFYDPSATPAQVYRKAFEIIRTRAGDSCHILDCGPGNITTGLINSMRIEYDQNYGYRSEAWRQYFMGPSSSAGALGKRYFFHQQTWTNDIDHLCMDLLSLRQSQAAASLIALSGGNTISGDRLVSLDPMKVEVLRKILPSTGEMVFPVDLYDSDPQTIFASTIHRQFGDWTIAGFFNPDLDSYRVTTYPLKRFNLDMEKTYLCYDFWEERFIGEISDTLSIETDPGGVRLVSLHEMSGLPQVISTSRHIMQGAIEIESVVFDTTGSCLFGTSLGPAHSSHSVVVYLPESYDWNPRQGKLFEDFGEYAVKKVAPNILRINLQFGSSGKINWKVCFEKTNR